MARAITIIHSKSRSEMRPAQKSLCAWRERSASLARSSSFNCPTAIIHFLIFEVRGFQRFLGGFGTKAVFERLLVCTAACGRPRRRPCSKSLSETTCDCLGPRPRLPPNQTEGPWSAPAHTSSRENAFSSYFWPGKTSLRTPQVVTRRFLKKSSAPDNRGERAVHFAGNGCWYW